MITIDEVISRLERPRIEELVKPKYLGHSSTKLVKIGFAIKSMENHTTNEGIEIFKGLENAGYLLAGKGFETFEFGQYTLKDETNISTVLNDLDPDTVVLQDKREWEGKTAGHGFDEKERFTNVSHLRQYPKVFKLTILKDAQNNPLYHKQSAEEIGCHAWIVYYNPKIVKHVAPFVREKHLVRTYHTVDRGLVPVYANIGRSNNALLSGAISGAYPLRKRINDARLKNVDILKHPGYGRNKCYTPEYLKVLSVYKVAICTASRYGYALRKLIEATACGCRVITDLPRDEVLPHIDGNFYRVHPDSSTTEISTIVNKLVREYDTSIQAAYAEAACQYYDYRAEGKRLADAIEHMRRTYNA